MGPINTKEKEIPENKKELLEIKVITTEIKTFQQKVWEIKLRNFCIK